DSWRGNPAHPSRGSLPSPNGGRIIHADGLILFNDSPSALGDLPFECVANQTFRRSSLPNIAPKILFALSAFAGLNPGSHAFQLVPCARRPGISVLPEKIGAIG